MFEGNIIPIKPTNGVMITMNPGYLGRSQLPDNVKASFRTTCMIVPDFFPILKYSLYCEGYKRGEEMATKIVGIMKHFPQILSPAP